MKQRKHNNYIIPELYDFVYPENRHECVVGWVPTNNRLTPNSDRFMYLMMFVQLDSQMFIILDINRIDCE